MNSWKRWSKHGQRSPKLISCFDEVLGVAHAPPRLPIVHVAVVLMEYGLCAINEYTRSEIKPLFCGEHFTYTGSLKWSTRLVRILFKNHLLQDIRISLDRDAFEFFSPHMVVREEPAAPITLGQQPRTAKKQRPTTSYHASFWYL